MGLWVVERLVVWHAQQLLLQILRGKSLCNRPLRFFEYANVVNFNCDRFSAELFWLQKSADNLVTKNNLLAPSSSSSYGNEPIPCLLASTLTLAKVTQPNGQSSMYDSKQ